MSRGDLARAPLALMAIAGCLRASTHRGETSSLDGRPAVHALCILGQDFSLCVGSFA